MCITTEEGRERSEVHEFWQRKTQISDTSSDYPTQSLTRRTKKEQKTEFHALRTNIKYAESLKCQVFRVVLSFLLHFATK